MANRQFKVLLSDDWIDRLDVVAKQFGKKSGNKVAEEVIREYLDLWIEAEQAKLDVRARQKASLDSGKEPLHHARKTR